MAADQEELQNSAYDQRVWGKSDFKKNAALNQVAGVWTRARETLNSTLAGIFNSSGQGWFAEPALFEKQPSV